MVENLNICLELKRDRRGVTALEYALIAGLVGVVISAALLRLGTSMGAVFTTISTTLSS